MTYSRNIANLFIFLLLIACSEDSSVTSPKALEQEVHFAFQPSSKSPSYVLTKSANGGVGVRSIVVTILDSNNSAIYTDFSIPLATRAFSEPILLRPGTYKLSEYRALDAIGSTLYATPKSSSPLASLVTNPLDIEFTVFKDSVTLVTPQVLEVENNTPQDFGYTFFSGSVPSFILKVFTQVYRIEENTFSSIDASIHISVRDSSDSLHILNYNITGGFDAILLPEAQDSTYTFTVSGNENTITRSLPYDSLTAGTGDTTYLVNFLLDSTIYVQWEHTGTLTLNTTSSGADVSTDIYNFPTLVRITDSIVFAQSQKNGEDLRFSRLDQSTIPYEIEEWDSSGHNATVWVYMDTIQGNSDSQSIRMHWGNPSANSESNGPEVFDAQWYTSVWHMNEDPSGGLSSIRDHTSNEQHLTPSGGMNSADLVNGVIGKALDLDGSDDYLDIGGFSSSLTTGFFMCMWVNYDTFQLWSRLWGCGNGRDSDNVLLANRATSRMLNFEVRRGSNNQIVQSDENVFTSNTWDYVCGVLTPQGEGRIYHNGELIKTASVHFPINIIRHQCYIGRSNWDFDGYLDAQIDEFITGKVEPSADRIKLYYESQKANANWITFTR